MAVASNKPASQGARRGAAEPALEAAPTVPEFSKEQELQAYRDMLLIRRFEEKAGQLYGMGLIGGFCHLYIGQEAVVVGMQMAIKAGDAVITGYRDHGHMLACGMDAKGVMAELTGRRGGYSKGKGGSMHMFSLEKGFFGGHGIVGAQVPLGTGLAFAAKYRGTDNVSLTYFGDGAANQGQVYESFNMAELWKLPVIYVIENNQYGMGTSVARASANTNLSQARRRARYSGRAGRRHGCSRRQGCRRSCGEMVPRRQRSDHSGNADLPLSRPFHVGSRPSTVRKEEVDKVRTEHDPIEQVRSRLLKQGLRDRGRLEEDRCAGPRRRQRGVRIRHQRCGAGSVRTLYGRLRLKPMSQFAAIVAYLALAGAIASWIAGAWFYARTLRAISRSEREAPQLARGGGVAVCAGPPQGRGADLEPLKSTRR